MEPEFSLLFAQESAVWPYPEPDKSTLYPYILFMEDPSAYYPAIYIKIF